MLYHIQTYLSNQVYNYLMSPRHFANLRQSDPAAYNKCLETEAAKVLDETGSNLDYANEVAAKACADLQ